MAGHVHSHKLIFFLGGRSGLDLGGEGHSGPQKNSFTGTLLG